MENLGMEGESESTIVRVGVTNGREEVRIDCRERKLELPTFNGEDRHGWVFKA